MARIAFAFTAAVSLWSCSLLLPLDGLATGEADLEAGAPEAGSPIEAGEPLSDAAPAFDAGEDGAAPDRCTVKAGRFCEDFDTDGGLACSLISDEGTSVKLVNGSADTAPRYLALGFSGAAGNQTAICDVPLGVLEPTTTYRISMAIRIDEQLPSDVRVLTVFPNPDESLRIVLVSRGPALRAQVDATLLDGGTRYSEPVELSAPLGAYGTWHDVALDFDLAKRTVRLSIDGSSRSPATFGDVKLDALANPKVRFGSDYAPRLNKVDAILLDTLAIVPL